MMHHRSTHIVVMKRERGVSVIDAFVEPAWGFSRKAGAMATTSHSAMRLFDVHLDGMERKCVQPSSDNDDGKDAKRGRFGG